MNAKENNALLKADNLELNTSKGQLHNHNFVIEFSLRGKKKEIEMNDL